MYFEFNLNRYLLLHSDHNLALDAPPNARSQKLRVLQVATTSPGACGTLVSSLGTIQKQSSIIIERKIYSIDEKL